MDLSKPVSSNALCIKPKATWRLDAKKFWVKWLRDVWMDMIFVEPIVIVSLCAKPPHRACIKTTKTRSFLEHQIQVEKINRMGRDFEGDTWNKSLVLISAGFFCKKKRGGKFVKPHKPTMKCFQKLISARSKAWIIYRIHLFHISSWWFHQTICRKMKVKLDDFPKLWLVVFKENPLKKPTTFCGKIQVLHL